MYLCQLQNLTINGLIAYDEPTDIQAGDGWNVGKHPQHEKCVEFLRGFKEYETETKLQTIIRYNKHIDEYWDLRADIEKQDELRCEELQKLADSKRTKTPVFTPSATVAALVGLTNPASALFVILPAATMLGAAFVHDYRNQDFHKLAAEERTLSRNLRLQRSKLPVPWRAAISSTSNPICQQYPLHELITDVQAIKAYGKTMWIFGKCKRNGMPLAVSTRGEFRFYQEGTDLKTQSYRWPGGNHIQIDNKISQILHRQIYCPAHLLTSDHCIFVFGTRKELDNDKYEYHAYCFDEQAGFWVRVSYKEIEVRSAMYEYRTVSVGRRPGSWGRRSVFTGFTDCTADTTKKYKYFRSVTEMLNELHRSTNWGHSLMNDMQTIKDRIQTWNYRVAHSI